MNETPIIFAFTGLAGSGKSTAADYLSSKHGFVRTRFASPLKAMVRGFLVNIGVRHDVIERMIEGDLKEVPANDFGGKTPRYVMQTIGSEWGRDIITPTLWTDAWANHVVRLIKAGQTRIVVEDCRFPNEMDAIRAMGGIVVRINANHAGLSKGAAGHASEKQDLAADLTLWNDGPVDIFHARLDGLLDRYCLAA